MRACRALPAREERRTANLDRLGFIGEGGVLAHELAHELAHACPLFYFARGTQLPEAEQVNR
jgi:hypothetical protein